METAPNVRSFGRRHAGLAGAVAAVLALGLTELFAGMSVAIPSAVSSIGSVVVDYSPPWVKDVAISTLGAADKGALAFGTVFVVVLVGVLIGRLSVTRFWVAPVAFGVFALLGIAAQLEGPRSNPGAIVVATLMAAAAGVGVLWLMLWPDAAADPDSQPADLGRRRFVALAGGAAVAGVITLAVGRQMIIGRAEQQIASATLPEPVVRALPPGPDNAFDVPGLTPVVVGNATFYRIDTALVVPVVDRDSWRLRVAGMVENELEFTLDDLLAMPHQERYITIACVSNRVGDDLVGNARWQGVPLTEILEMAGPTEGATQIVGRSVDGWTAGFPTASATDGRDPLVVVGMNGETLPRAHGYPARLVVPGLYGYVSATKWLQEIELTTWEAFDAYWIPRGWAKEGPIKTQSRIDRPRAAEQLPVGAQVVAGVAWAPTRGISRVEVQLDEEPWREAALTAPLSVDAWVQWVIEVNLSPGRHRLRVRATDGSGTTQSEREVPPRPDGAEGWHTRIVDAA